jgi:hypothetical protein
MSSPGSTLFWSSTGFENFYQSTPGKELEAMVCDTLLLTAEPTPARAFLECILKLTGRLRRRGLLEERRGE